MIAGRVYLIAFLNFKIHVDMDMGTIIVIHNPTCTCTNYMEYIIDIQ